MTIKVKCPACEEDTTMEGNQFRPFCSERCKLTDLGAWAEEKYSIPCEEVSDESEYSADRDEGEELNKITYH